MSYCRRSDPQSDLYVYEIEDGRVVCDCCPFGGHRIMSKLEMVIHVAEHVEARHAVLAGLREHLLFDADTDSYGGRGVSDGPGMVYN